MSEYIFKYIIIDIFILYFKNYLHSFTQSTVFTGRVARQTYRLHVLYMIVKLACTCTHMLKSFANIEEYPNHYVSAVFLTFQHAI